MTLNSIGANRYIFDGQVHGKPLRLLLRFDEDRALRLQVAGDGARMIADGGLLDESFDMGEFGQVDIADVTQSLFPALCGVEVTDIEALTWRDCRVGVRLNIVGSGPFHFWVDGDELWWGDEAALVRHEWLDGQAPSASERIQV